MPGIAIPFLSLFIKFKFIFDIRGFWADEKHDRLGWSKLSYKYKFFKILESYLIKKADYIVTLTKQSKDIIIDNFTKDQSRITVIPTCVDFQEIYAQPALEKPKNLIIGYLGSVDTAYDFSKFCFFINQVKSFKHEVELRIFKSQKIEEVITPYARKIGFSSQKKGLFNNYKVSKLTPDYYLSINNNGIIIEVERGQTTQNNAALKDLWKAHICEEADYLFLFVPNKLIQNKEGKVAGKPFNETVNRISTFYDPINYTNVKGTVIFGY